MSPLSPFSELPRNTDMIRIILHSTVINIMCDFLSAQASQLLYLPLGLLLSVAFTEKLCAVSF